MVSDHRPRVPIWNPSLELDRAPLPLDSSIRDFPKGKAGYVANTLKQPLLLPQDMANLKTLKKHEIFLTLKKDLSMDVNGGDLQYDPEIERTLRRLGKEARKNSEEHNLALDSLFANDFDLEEEEVMVGNQTSKELATPDLNQQPLCITFPTLDATTTFELKSGLIHLLPIFHGLAGEDPHKHLNELYALLIQYFYENLLPTDKSMIDASSRGALVDKTPEAARNLIANMATNSQQFGTRLDPLSKHFNEVSISSLEQQIASLTSLVRQMAVSNMQTVKACGICLVVGHPTDMCPTFQEEPIEQVNVAGDFPGQTQRKYDPYSNTYNSGWRDHPNLSYGNPQETKQFQQETRANIQSLENQMGQMATAISRLEAQSSRKLPSQTVVNPREYASTIILRSGKEVEILVKATPASSKQEKEQNIVADKNVPNNDERKQKLKGYKKVRVGENVSAVIQRKLPAKCKGPGMFTIPCTIGNTQLEKAMLDLGASINVMPYSIYVSLKLGPLNKTIVVIQLTDRSITYPKGVVEDVLVQVNDLVFSADFYVLDMENGDQTTPILLGRPFLKTSKIKIDVHSGTLTMEFDGEIVKFNINDAMKYLDDDNPVYLIDVIDSLAQEVFELDGKDGMEVAISKHLEKENEELA
nr:uncharacterized protein LOC112012777 [Quercus suber]